LLSAAREKINNIKLSDVFFFQHREL